MTWNAPERRFFETGLDRGVLYPKKAPPIAPVEATNLITNPEFGTGITGWTLAEVGDLVRTSEGDSWAGQYTKGATVGNDWVSTEYVLTTPTSVTHVSLDLKLQVEAASYRLVLMWYAGESLLWVTSGAIVPSTSLSDSTYTTLTVSDTAPAGTNRVRVQVQPTTQLANGSGFRIKNAMVTVGESSVPYFSGTTLGTDIMTYEWTGTPHASTSVKRPLLTSAVPWDGLTSVEESGGEGARAYYVDGRPFLFLPMPKEYKSTLNAYTYPDAFSEIMGLAEVTDGMYLDSQPGAAFDLSYRTLIGNATEGMDHGYKIHLVYNATVTPGGVNYETLGDSVNPSTMSWEIQAVPVKVQGFRPTAHIIIDTRHMDPDTINAIEELLYGSDDKLARMPPPQLVFDILNYGSTIVVTDNGDGTFDVEGSYKNVYMVGDGEFSIDNVDGQDYGDGTFAISTTES